MKTRGIWKILLLGTVGLLFLSNSSPLGSETTVLPPLDTVVADETIASQTVDTVVIKGMVFNPQELHVHKGDTVVWINEDIVAHNATDFPGNKWTSGTLARGSSWKKKIDETFDYYCSIHPTMKGKIIVDP